MSGFGRLWWCRSWWCPGCLASLALATSLSVAGAAGPSSLPALADVERIPHLGERGQAGYRQFLSATPHRGFAIAPGGGWGMSLDAMTPELAMQQALASCQQHTRQTCVPYALDRRVVFDAAAWSTLWRPYLSAAEARQAPPGTRRGERFPDLGLQTPQGEPWRLSDQRGKVVLLHFWGTWCPSCVHELPQFVRLQAALADRDDMVFVYTQARESAATARAWLAQHKLELAVHDSGVAGSEDHFFHLGDGSPIPDRELAPLFPMTYVLDRHGVVVFRLLGSARDWMEFEAFLRDVLNHRQGKPD
jgi:thiol-disulfide isomerase/thioredoxin